MFEKNLKHKVYKYILLSSCSLMYQLLYRHLSSIYIDIYGIYLKEMWGGINGGVYGSCIPLPHINSLHFRTPERIK